MEDGKFKKYLINSIALLKKQAINARKLADDSEGDCGSYKRGVVMGYCMILSTLKHQADVFGIDQEELGLADVDPELDMLGLRTNPDLVSSIEWDIDVFNEQKAEGYLYDLIAILIQRAIEAKKDVVHSKINSVEYSKGELKAYCSVLSNLKKQAQKFGINEEEINLSTINPEKDLV